MGVKPVARPVEPGRPEFQRRGDNRPMRPGGSGPGQRFPGQQRPAAGQKPAEPAKPAAPKFVLPEGAQVIIIKPPIVVRELAEQLKQKPFKIILS